MQILSPRYKVDTDLYIIVSDAFMCANLDALCTYMYISIFFGN